MGRKRREPRGDMRKAIAQFDELRQCVSVGLHNVPQEQWQSWIESPATPEIFRRVCELGSVRAGKLLDEYVPEWFVRGDFNAFRKEQSSCRELKLPRKHTLKWHDRGDHITFSVTSSGMTNLEWLRRMVEHLDLGSFHVLRSPEFASTRGVMYDVAVLKGASIRSSVPECYEVKMDQYLRVEGHRRGWKSVPIEVACLMWECLPDRLLDQMGFSQVIVMHNPAPMESGFGAPKGPLAVLQSDDGDSHLMAVSDCYTPTLEQGFAFLLSHSETEE